MSVINNAHSGSHIPSLIFVDRLLNRNIIKSSEFISIKSIISQNSPDSLFIDEMKDNEGNFKIKDNPKKKLPETLQFWIKQGLWDSSTEGIKAFSALSNDFNIHARIVRSVFNKTYDLHTGSSIEPLIRGMCLFLAIEEITFSGGVFFKHTEIPTISARYMPERSKDGTRLSMNPDDRRRFAEFGLLLGFMEKINKDKYVVDPTRLIKIFLYDIFSETSGDSISIHDFIKRLNSQVPIFDGGKYRVEIEALMQSKKIDWLPSPSHTLSKSLSHALYRLNLENHIYLDRLSDSLDAVSLPLPNGETRTVSHIRIVGGK
ncbi:protein DpdG [Colwellia psychrerythraea]|uniref:Uncharacterized protein n=1 Tax=Colwellia psychrerythraea (strain 34H / ATCC BAA-681) TaxID=167879 RepID=Q47ZX5_COLP3|nr:protein DpdG [Colwellia psychrerythraea]AAZ27336.1 hypothetical protein CPS_2944 [Colwellia psychrerythraea 34H]